MSGWVIGWIIGGVVVAAVVVLLVTAIAEAARAAARVENVAADLERARRNTRPMWWLQDATGSMNRIGDAVAPATGQPDTDETDQVVHDTQGVQVRS